MRIVSLLPSATEIICELGLAAQLVGVTHECDYPPAVRGIRKVTRTLIPTDAGSAAIDRLVRKRRTGRKALYSLDFEAMRELAPHLIVSQTLCEVCAVDDREVRRYVKDLTSDGGRRPRIVYLEPTRLGDVLVNIVQIAAATDVAATGNEMVARLQRRIDAVSSRAAKRDGRPRVAVIEWLDPLFTSGHWTPEIVELAGGCEPLARAGERSRRMDESELVASDPDLILIACCGFSIERTMQDVPAFLARPEIAAMRSVRERRVFVTDGSAYFSRPGPRLVDALEALSELLLGRVPAGADAFRSAFEPLAR